VDGRRLARGMSGDDVGDDGGRRTDVDSLWTRIAT
jgi:hypothetical protein